MTKGRIGGSSLSIILSSLITIIWWYTTIIPSALVESFITVPRTRANIQVSHSTTRSVVKRYLAKKNLDPRVVEASFLGGDQNQSKNQKLGSLIRRAFLVSSLVAAAQFTLAQAMAPPGFRRIPTQFIAALGDPRASSGTGANQWGLWKVDPGPRGVFLRDYGATLAKKPQAPAGWTFDPQDWWLEEHGLIMEAPTFPIPPGRYYVTGGRQVSTILNIDGTGRWQLDQGQLYDVTHLPCRSARYSPAGNPANGGTPASARLADFPVSPGAEMPHVPGCRKQDYAVLFVIGVDDQTLARNAEL